MNKFKLNDVGTDGIFKMKVVDIYKDTNTGKYYYECSPEMFKLEDRDETRLIPESQLTLVDDKTNKKLI